MEVETSLSINKLCLKKNTCEIITKILKLQESDQNIIISDINFTNGSKAGDNYLSHLQRATIKGVRENGEGYIKTFIVKCALNQDQHSAFFNYTKLWFNEINVYKEVIPRIEKACRKKLYHPQLLYGDADFIILEDLKPLGYDMIDRRIGLDLEHAKVALEEVADFHSGSLIMRHNDTNEINKIKSIIGKHPYQEDEGITGAIPLMQNAIDTAVKKLSDSKGNQNKFIPFINYILYVKDNISNILRNIVQMTPTIFTVIGHGDCYINNFLFSYSEDRNVDSLMLVDYQGTRIISLMLDLHHMIYTSLQPKVRREYLEILLKHYHRRLCDNLKNSTVFEVDYLNTKLSFDNFKFEFDNNHVVGLLSALTILPAMTYSPENIPEVSKVTKSWGKNSDEENMEQFYTGDLTERFEDLAEEFIKKGWCPL